MEKTLYLNENKKIQVMRDGPSVWIKEEEKAGVRIPVRLVARVVIIGNVRLEAGVITIFTENKIPVTFINNRGDECAVAVPYHLDYVKHYDEQKLLLESEKSIQQVKTWLTAKRKTQQLRVIKCLSEKLAEEFTVKGFRQRDYQTALDKYKPIDRDQWKKAANIIKNLFRELVLSMVINAGFNPHFGVLQRGHDFSFVLDLCYILEPEIDLQCIQYGKNSRTKRLVVNEANGSYISKEGMRDIISRFENRKKALLEIIGILFDDVFELMRELR